MDYALHLLVVASIYTILAVSLDLLVGHTGLLSLAHGAFFGVGAYASALVATETNGSFLLGLVVAPAAAVVASLLLSLPSLRLHGDYLVICTLGAQLILFTLFDNWTGLTGGPLGIAGIPRPQFLGWECDSSTCVAVLVVALAAFCYFLALRVSESPFGRVLRAIREDEILVRSLGRNPSVFKVLTFAFSAALAGCAGSLYAHHASYIAPPEFGLMESVFMISIVIVGGAGSRWGPLVGAFALVTLPELLRFVGMPSAVAANVRQILYGVLLVLVVMYRSGGLLGRYRFTR